jgi:hypothetical protein
MTNKEDVYEFDGEDGVTVKDKTLDGKPKMGRPRNRTGRKVKCRNPKCGYEWKTNSKAMFICCPVCHHAYLAKNMAVTNKEKV